MVINIGMLKAKDTEYVTKDIKAVVDAAGGAWSRSSSKPAI